MSKFKVGSPEFIAKAKSLGLDPYEYFYFRKYQISKDKMEMSDRVMKVYISLYIMPMLEEWSEFFEYNSKRKKRKLQIVNKLLKEFCNNMGYTVEDYPEHYANIRGYESWQKFRKGENKNLCMYLKEKYCETKDPNSLFLSIDTLREVTGCRIPVKKEERIKKEKWLTEELTRIEEEERIKKEKEDEEDRERKMERDEKIRWIEQCRRKILEMHDKNMEHEKYIYIDINEDFSRVPHVLQEQIPQVQQVQVHDIKYEVRIIDGKPHKCKTDRGIIVKDCGQYDIRKRKVIGPPLLDL